jgi:RNA polymerase sigma-70 factor (ECF subfamily)
MMNRAEVVRPDTRRLNATKQSAEAPPPVSPGLLPGVVFRKYAPQIYHLVHRLPRNPADAEDVTQSGFVQLVRKLPTFQGRAALSTWLHRDAVNAALAFRRQQLCREGHRAPGSFLDFGESSGSRIPPQCWATNPLQQVLDQERYQLIEEAIGRLPEGYRDLYVLADIEERGNAEVGNLLGLSVPAVKSRLHRARQLMRTALALHFEERAAALPVVSGRQHDDRGRQRNRRGSSSGTATLPTPLPFWHYPPGAAAS